MTAKTREETLSDELRDILSGFSLETIRRIRKDLPFLIARAKLTLINGGKVKVADGDEGLLKTHTRIRRRAGAGPQPRRRIRP